jgi:hypothetical protein
LETVHWDQVYSIALGDQSIAHQPFSRAVAKVRKPNRPMRSSQHYLFDYQYFAHNQKCEKKLRGQKR